MWSFSSRIHLPRSFAALIHDLHSLSVEFSVSCSSSLRNSLVPSSNLLLRLPIALYVLCLELSSGFRSAAFTIHLSFGRDPILSANVHFFLLCVLIQHRIFASSILSMTSSMLLLCIQSNLLLRSRLYQFHHRYRFRKICRCPDRCVCLSFAVLLKS